MNISIFFGSIIHTVASFLVATLISSGLATTPNPAQPIVVVTQVSSMTPSNLTASSTDQSSAVVKTKFSTQSIKIATPSVPSATVTSSIENQTVVPVAATQTPPPTNNVSTVSPSAEETPTTLTIKPDTSGFSGTTAQAFYNISSDSQSEVDIKEMSFNLNKVSVSGSVLIIITDDTNEVVLTSSSANSSYNPQTEELSVEATFNKPLRIMSGYPTMFDIQAEPVAHPPSGQPNITIDSVGSNYILNAGRPVVLF